jgi:hypothetical protein
MDVHNEEEAHQFNEDGIRLCAVLEITYVEETAGPVQLNPGVLVPREDDRHPAQSQCIDALSDDKFADLLAGFVRKILPGYRYVGFPEVR